MTNQHFLAVFELVARFSDLTNSNICIPKIYWNKYYFPSKFDLKSDEILLSFLMPRICQLISNLMKIKKNVAQLLNSAYLLAYFHKNVCQGRCCSGQANSRNLRYLLISFPRRMQKFSKLFKATSLDCFVISKSFE